ncbi:MAG: hypothetical protein HFG13_07885 [Oscillibacter sp.]|nr:hypothetical protein [Oscillibacter sp.]
MYYLWYFNVYDELYEAISAYINFYNNERYPKTRLCDAYGIFESRDK